VLWRTSLHIIQLTQHFSSCHQPTAAPDSVIYSQCYCDTFFQAVYSTCLTSCGWASAGIPPLTSILETCSTFFAVANPSPAQTAGSGNTGGNTAHVTPVVETSNSPKATTNGNANSQSSTSGSGDEDDNMSLLYRVEGVLLGGFVLGWMFGWL
jgi:hypothetical protein